MAPDYGYTAFGPIGGVFVLGVGMLVLGIPLMLACFAFGTKRFFRGETLNREHRSHGSGHLLTRESPAMHLTVGYLATPTGDDGIALASALAKTFDASVDVLLVVREALPDGHPGRAKYQELLVDRGQQWIDQRGRQAGRPRGDRRLLGDRGRVVRPVAASSSRRRSRRT